MTTGSPGSTAEIKHVLLHWPFGEEAVAGTDLIESQRTFAELGAMEHRFTGLVREASADEAREHGWRPIDLDRDSFEECAVQESAWPSDYTALYWWRPDFWRSR